jgi:hypothetical protein
MLSVVATIESDSEHPICMVYFWGVLAANGKGFDHRASSKVN